MNTITIVDLLNISIQIKQKLIAQPNQVLFHKYKYHNFMETQEYAALLNFLSSIYQLEKTILWLQMCKKLHE